MQAEKASGFRRHNPMLAEMIIILLFFAVCACILVGVFGEAYSLSERSDSMNKALYYAQSLAEGFKCSEDSVPVYLQANGFKPSEGGFTKDMRFSKSVYKIACTPDSRLSGFDIRVTVGGDACFNFRVLKAIGEAD